MFNTEIGQIIASRELTDAKDPKRRIIVSLGLPRRVRLGQWQCPVRIDGLNPKPISRLVSGVDSLQALLLAFQYLRLTLKDSHRRLACADEGIPRSAGDIPLQVSTSLGEEFEERIEQLIEREAPRLLEIRWKMIRSHILEAEKKRTTSHERASSRRRRRSE